MRFKFLKIIYLKPIKNLVDTLHQVFETSYAHRDQKSCLSRKLISYGVFVIIYVCFISQTIQEKKL